MPGFAGSTGHMQPRSATTGYLGCMEMTRVSKPNKTSHYKYHPLDEAVVRGKTFGDASFMP